MRIGFEGNAGPSPLFGYALDGYGIYGPRGEDGQMITNSQLDQCHGHTESVLWDGKITRIYHYHLNREYPYSIGCFHGAVDYAKVLPNTDMTEGANYAAITTLDPGKIDVASESTITQITEFFSTVITKFLR
jgi:hypothetical protein